MDKIITLLFLTVSTICIGQIDTEKLVGKWLFSNTTDSIDSIVESPVKTFELNLLDGGQFKMAANQIVVNGTWSVKDSILILNGKRQGMNEAKVERMKIYSLSNTTLSIEYSSENKTEKAMNFIKLE